MAVDIEQECKAALASVQDAVTALANATGYTPLEDSDDSLEIIGHAQIVAGSLEDAAERLAIQLRALAHDMEERLGAAELEAER
jgi:hypothetical protein